MRHIRTFKKCEEVKKSGRKLKLVKNAFLFLVTASIVGALYLHAPFVQGHAVTNDYVADHTAIEQVAEAPNYTSTDVAVASEMTENVQEEYAPNPYIYEGEVKAFIEAPGMLDQVYPVAQTDDNDYYLHHDVNGDESSLGTIFKDCRNGESFSNDVSIVYGHNMRDGSMFGNLSNYADKTVGSGQEVYNDNSTFDWKDEYGHYELEVFAAGAYDSIPIYNSVGNFENEEDFQNFVNMVYSGSDIKTDVDLQYGDKIVCLWTCLDGDSIGKSDVDNRALVFAKAKQLEKYKDLPEITNQRSL